MTAPEVGPERAEAIARHFSRLLRETLTAEELTAAIEANAVDGDPRVCHSHDYCDANVVMAAAFLAETGDDIIEFIHDAERRALWGAAWDLAKANRFYVAVMP